MFLLAEKLVIVTGTVGACCCLWGAGMAQWLSTRLPSMWPEFESRTRRHMWVEFVVGSRPCSERFFSGLTLS